MNLKARLQRVLQIVEDAERTGVLSDLEKDIVLSELREAYAELKFGITENGERKAENEEEQQGIAPINHIEEEPEVEVELLFDEESEEELETESGELETESGEPQTENEEQSEIAPNTPNASNAPSTPTAAEPQDELSSLVTPHSSNKRSPLLSLYEESAPVIGEQFHDAPSVADTIVCPKGVSENAPISSLREAIGVADRFMLIRELFEGDAAAYDSVIDALDKQPSFDDCIIYIAENYTWSTNSQATKLVMDLLQRKYK
ncbi:MAG: hypothetical protein IKA26_07990 [Alistipes sp.]|nr:hypothetical protein [Alistipes sp.]